MSMVPAILREGENTWREHEFVSNNPCLVGGIRESTHPELGSEDSSGEDFGVVGQEARERRQVLHVWVGAMAYQFVA